jgi:hypothetical protein
MRKQNEAGRKDLAEGVLRRKEEREKRKNKQKSSVTLTTC